MASRVTSMSPANEAPGGGHNRTVNRQRDAIARRLATSGNRRQQAGGGRLATPGRRFKESRSAYGGRLPCQERQLSLAENLILLIFAHSYVDRVSRKLPVLNPTMQTQPWPGVVHHPG